MLKYGTEHPATRHNIPCHETGTLKITSRSGHGQLTVKITVSPQSGHGQQTVSLRSDYGQVTIKLRSHHRTLM